MKNKFAKREWFMVIGITILLQFLIQIGAWIYSTDSSVLDYISFAGTIVSIILALLAIIYGYVQTVTQQNSVQKLRSQIDQLINVTNNIETSEGELSGLISTLTKVRKKIDSSIQQQEKIKSSIDVIQDRMKFLGEKSTKDSTGSDNGLEQNDLITDKEKFYRKLLSNSPNGLQISLLAILLGYKNDLTVEEASEIFSTKMEDIFVDEPSGKFKEYMEGGIRFTFFIFNSLGEINYENYDVPYTISDTFLEELETFSTFIDETQNEENTFFNVYQELKSFQLQN